MKVNYNMLQSQSRLWWSMWWSILRNAATTKMNDCRNYTCIRKTQTNQSCGSAGGIKFCFFFFSSHGVTWAFGMIPSCRSICLVSWRHPDNLVELPAQKSVRIHQSTGAEMWKSNSRVHNFKILQSPRIAFLRLKNAIQLYLKLCTQELDFHISAPVDCHHTSIACGVNQITQDYEESPTVSQ